MIKSEALSALADAEGELIIAEIDHAEAEEALSAAMERVAETKLRLQRAKEDESLKRQIADSFDRGGRHAAKLEDFQENLRVYILNRGSIEQYMFRSVPQASWAKLSMENQNSALIRLKQSEHKVEQEILAGYRNQDGDYFAEFAHMEHEEAVESVNHIMDEFTEKERPAVADVVIPSIISQEAPKPERGKVGFFGKRKKV